MFEQAKQIIEKYNTIVIHRHTQPDGDALGSQIGLKHLINTNYPKKQVYIVGDEAKRYAFMDDSVMDTIDDSIYCNALAIVLDSATAELVNDKRFSLASETLRLDHHIFCEKFCDTEIVDTSFESCAGMVAYLAKESNWKLDEIGAKSIFTGMVTDSGRFRYDSTNARTFELASFLLTAGFNTDDIYNNLYVDDYELVKLRAQFVINMNKTPQGVGYVYTTKEQLKSYGVDTFTISRGMVNTMAGIRGINIWVNFTETEDTVLCELRSNKVSINPIAVKYGGGGHAKASGCDVKDYAQAMQLVEDCNKLLEENND